MYAQKNSAHLKEPFGVQRARKLRLEFRKSKKSSGVPLQGSGHLIKALLYFIFVSSSKGTFVTIGYNWNLTLKESFYLIQALSNRRRPISVRMPLVC